MSRLEDADRIIAAIHRLTESRGPDRTCCPSEVAHRVAADDWRSAMPAVRAAAVMLACRGEIDICRGGRTLDFEAPLRGPIRLRRRGC